MGYAWQIFSTTFTADWKFQIYMTENCQVPRSGMSSQHGIGTWKELDGCDVCM
jgi:hypothetical protein